MPKRRYILVCDASRARLFREESLELTLVAELAHPASRLHTRDLVTDAQGRKPGGVPGALLGYRPGAEPDTEPKEVEADKFARSLADLLERGRLDNAFDELVLVAPPHFLGALSDALGHELRKRVVARVGKDLTTTDERDLPGRLRPVLS